MSPAERSPTTVRARREPPPFRRVAVRRVERVSPRMVRVTLAGPELEGLTVEQPAASVRLLLPSPGAARAGHADLERQRVPPARRATAHASGRSRRAASTPTPSSSTSRSSSTAVGSRRSGRRRPSPATRRRSRVRAVATPIDRDAPAFLLAGDETAIPAISQLLEACPPRRRCRCTSRSPTRTLGSRCLTIRARPSSGATCRPGRRPATRSSPPSRGADLGPDTRVWVAGEAAAVQRIRRHLFEDRGMPRAQATVRGYWKHGRSGDADATTPERASADSGGVNGASSDPLATNSSLPGAAASPERLLCIERPSVMHARRGSSSRSPARQASK